MKMIADGCDLRLWCFRCGRGDKRVMTPELLPAIVDRAVCKICRRRDQVLLLPARSDFRPSQEGQAATDLIAGWFHAVRKAGKRRR